MKNAVLDVTPCDSCKSWRSSETSVLTRTTRRNIPEDGFPQLYFTLHKSFTYKTIAGPNSRVVDEDVHSSQIGFDPLEGFRDLWLLADVTLQWI
jgi:hypothetical protein